MTPPTPSSRRPDLDALRVGCILLLHLYHSARMFNVDDPWHVKAPVLLPVLNGPMDVLHMVRMPMLMLIAGLATAFALRRRSVGTFAWDRVKRLLLPLVFGMLVIVPPQIWVERVWTGATTQGYLAWWPSVLAGVPYPKGSTSWHHLWFVAYLFTFCMAALPIFAALNSARGQAWLGRTGAFLARGANLWVLGVLLFAGRFLFRNHPETHDLLHDPKNLIYYGGLFLIGHLLGRMPRVEARLVDLRRAHLILAVGLLAVSRAFDHLPPPVAYLSYYGAIWATLCAALGYGRVLVTASRPWLDHAQALAYPFYILHQSVIVVLGWWMLRLHLAPWTFFVTLTAASFLVTWLLCEGAARVAWLRPLLGMAPRKAVPAPAPGILQGEPSR